MKKIVSIFLAGSLAILTGCFLFVTFDVKMTGRIAMLLGWLAAIFALCLLIRYFWKREKQRV